MYELFPVEQLIYYEFFMKKVIAISCVVVGALLIIILPSVLSQRTAKNGFQRIFSGVDVELINSILLDNNYYSFAGRKDSMMLLQNFNSPASIYSVLYPRNELKENSIAIPRNFDISLGPIKIGIEHNSMYVKNNRGDLLIGYNDSINYFNTDLYFDQTYLTSKNSLIVRSKNNFKRKANRVLQKLEVSKLKTGIIKSYILPKQVDGVFCTDGWLKYDSSQGKIIYLFAYRGSFVVLDTNLNILNLVKTIDTVQKAQLNLVTADLKLDNGDIVKQTMQKSPPKVVSRGGCIDGGSFFIMSNLKSDNETLRSYLQNQPIDVYSLYTNSYSHSFYLPKINNLKPREIEIDGDVLAALYGNTIVLFRIYGKNKM